MLEVVAWLLPFSCVLTTPGWRDAMAGRHGNWSTGCFGGSACTLLSSLAGLFAMHPGDWWHFHYFRSDHMIIKPNQIKQHCFSERLIKFNTYCSIPMFSEYKQVTLSQFAKLTGLESVHNVHAFFFTVTLPSSIWKFGTLPFLVWTIWWKRHFISQSRVSCQEHVTIKSGLDAKKGCCLHTTEPLSTVFILCCAVLSRCVQAAFALGSSKNPCFIAAVGGLLPVPKAFSVSQECAASSFALSLSPAFVIDLVCMA